MTDDDVKAVAEAIRAAMHAQSGYAYANWSADGYESEGDAGNIRLDGSWDLKPIAMASIAAMKAKSAE